MSRLSLLFINQHYWPDVASTGQHLTDLAEHLAGEGFEVDVLSASGGYLAGKTEVPTKEVRNGVRIQRARTTSFGRGSHVGRIIDYASFYVQVLTRLLFRRRYDLVVVLTTPPLLGFALAVVGGLKRQRYAIWSMDLHPDAEEALGMLRTGSLLARLLHGLNGIGYRRAGLVVDLGPVMKDRLLGKGVSASRLETVPVWSKGDEVYPIGHDENRLREELGLSDKFVVMYSGNAGLAHRFDEVLEVMRRLKTNEAFHFLFVGAGPRRVEIEDFIDQNGITNARYLDYFPRDQLANSLSVGDAHLLTLRNDMGGIAAPGKLYGIIAAGRPVIVIGPGQSEPAITTAEEEVGVVIDTSRLSPADAADRLEAELLRLQQDESARWVAGRHARRVFEEKFEQGVVCREWSRLLRARVHSFARSSSGGAGVVLNRGGRTQHAG